MTSVAESLASLPPPQREEILRSLTTADAAALLADWRFWARPDQLPPPGDWRTWLILAGRGWGKTRTGAEWVRHMAITGQARRIALVARTAADVRDVIVEGESGLLAIHRRDERPTWIATKRQLRWPNGALATTYSADEPDQLRGPQSDAAWCDELAAWRYPEAWDQLQFGLRLGQSPRVVVTTTPRPTPIVRSLAASPDTLVTRGRTADNRRNLARGVVDDLERRYAGTRLGRQELDGEILTDTPGALWTYSALDALRRPAPAALRRVVVAVDPAVSSTSESDETGIVAAGFADDGHVYVLADESGRWSPAEWAARTARLYERLQADRVIAEANQGGALVEANLRAASAHLPVTLVHASRGKRARAEPVAALYEQARVHHVGALARLEDQLCTWDGSGASPDRLDALVWAVTALILAPPRSRSSSEPLIQ